MDGKELYEALDTVWTALPTDAARQEFSAAMEEITHREWDQTYWILRRWTRDKVGQ